MELPDGMDGERLFHASLARGVSITPGSVFSTTARFDGYVRISTGLPWSEQVEQAIATLGELAHALG